MMNFKLINDEKIELLIASLICPVHSIPPKEFKMTSKGFHLETCCIEFADICEFHAKHLIESDIDSNIKDYIDRINNDEI